MRFMIMHRTNAHWEAGAVPSPELVSRVGRLLEELAGAGALLAAEGLRPSSQGVRLRFTDGSCRSIEGPFERGSELPAGFTIVRARSLEEAAAWASRLAVATGDEEIDVRPVTEPWDIGMAPRPTPEPPRRYMVLRKATADTEAGVEPSPARRAALSEVIADAARAGVHVASETMRPSSRGRRCKNSRDGVTFVDGPFVETRELIGGYVVVQAPSLDEAARMAARYVEAVGTHEVDVRELE